MVDIEVRSRVFRILSCEALSSGETHVDFIVNEYPKLGEKEGVGFHLYESSLCLASHLLWLPKSSLSKTSSILELGAGISGLPSIAICKRNDFAGCQVTITDTASVPKIVDYLKLNVAKNVKVNQFLENVHVDSLEWGDWESMKKFGEEKKFDLILGSDLIYNETSIHPLLVTIKHFIKKQCLLSFEERNEDLYKKFAKTAKEMGLKMKLIKKSINPDYEIPDYLKLFALSPI